MRITHRQRAVSIALAGALAVTALVGVAVGPAADVSAASAAATIKSPTCDSTWYPTITSMSRDTQVQNLFTNYSNQAGPGDWVGGDSNYIVKLPDGRYVALYSDTFTGPVNPDGSIAASGNFIHNSMLVYNGTSATTLRGGTAAAPLSLVSPSDPTDWYWQNAAQVSGNELQVIMLEFHQTGTGPFDFQWVRTVVARYNVNTLALIGISPLPSSITNLEWNAWLQQEGGYTYVYGVRDLSSSGGPKYLHIARVAGTDLTGAWQFYTGSGWSSSEADSADLITGVGNNFSVSEVGGVYVLVTQDTSVAFSRSIDAYFSCSLTGPFIDKTFIANVPETGPTGTYGNANIIFYNVHEQTAFRNGNTLVFSYDLNSFDPADVHADVAIYRPRYWTVTLSVPQ